MSATTEDTTGNTSTWHHDARDALRRLAVASCVGAALGLLVGGIGGRLFMGLLARLNTEDHGVITSDGFPMGEVTASGTLNLLAVGTVLGVLGAGIYLALRGFTIGPPWFRRLCVIVGGTVMVGTVMVHEDGPDFTLLEPTWAALALTLATPLVFCVAVAPAVDRAVRDGSWLMRMPATWLGLVPWVFPLFVFTPLLVAGWAVTRLVATRLGPSAHRTYPWVVRSALVVVFLLGAANLVAEIVAEIVAIYDTVSTGRYLLG